MFVRDLIGCIKIIMSNWNICCYVWFDSKRKFDQVSRDVIKVVGFGIKCKYWCFF